MSMTTIVRRLIALSFLILFSAAAGIAKASEERRTPSPCDWHVGRRRMCSSWSATGLAR